MNGSIAISELGVSGRILMQIDRECFLLQEEYRGAWGMARAYRHVEELAGTLRGIVLSQRIRNFVALAEIAIPALHADLYTEFGDFGDTWGKVYHNTPIEKWIAILKRLKDEEEQERAI